MARTASRTRRHAVMIVAGLSLGSWIIPSFQLVKASSSNTTPPTPVTAGNVQCTGCVTTADIADGAVTVAKIGTGSVATDQLHDSAVNSNKLQALSVANGHIQDNAVTGGKIAANQIGTGHLQDQSVNGNKIADGSVSNNHLQNAAVHGNNIMDGSVANNHLQNAAVHGNNIMDGSVANNHLQNAAVHGNNIMDGSIANNHLQNAAVHGNNIMDGSIANNHLQPAAVTSDKLANGAVGNGQLAPLAVDLTNLDNALQALLSSFVTQGTFNKFTSQLSSPGGAGNMVDFSQVRTTTYSLYRPNADGLFAGPLNSSQRGYGQVAALSLPVGSYSISAELDVDNGDPGIPPSANSPGASGAHNVQCDLVAETDSDISQVTVPAAVTQASGQLTDGRARDGLVVQHQFASPGAAVLQCERADGSGAPLFPRNIRLTANQIGNISNQ